MSDLAIGAAVLGAIVGGLLGLWLVGTWTALLGAIVGAVLLPAILKERQ